MNLSNLLNSSIGQTIVKSVADQFGLDESQAASAVNTAVPVILGGLNKNIQTPEGAESLNNALESKHDGSLLDNLGGILSGNVGDLQQDGGSILNHVFGNNVGAVQNGIAQKTGISADKIGPIISMLAPVVMAYLGKQKSQNNVNAGGLGDLLGGMLGGGSAQNGGGLLDMVTGFLDKDKDGSALDDILGMFTK
ncbi:MAG TPA: DUF937 domain-containing protein [Paludibacteraceae bacterium]|nr:DUF937 domain-containing protein [Paludibacteraceae bacterium]HPT43561.1 DUF937 domain-containing protein [Paludibacteraceae bacterium]